jgi:predicted Zn-dependent peptidase
MKLLRKKLSNGITVIMEPRDLPLVSLSITNMFGAAFEESKIKGIAHFIEHLVFTGTKSRSHEDISREIEKKGGILNAFTSQDVTSYWFKLPNEHVFSGLDILTDMLNNATFEKRKFEKEKKVIIEEIKMYHDMPQRHIHDKIEENLYKKPFGEGVIGSVKTVSDLDRDFVADYFSKHYNPENYIVTIVGNADFKNICQYLEKTFKSKNLTFKPKKIEKQNKDSLEERAGIDQAHFMLAFHAPLATEPSHAHLEVLDAHLASGMSSRLFLEIREKRGLAYTVRSYLSTEKHYSYYAIYVGTTKEAIPEVKKLILQEFNHAATQMTDQNLKEAKERLIGLKKVSSEESSSVMNELVFEELSNKAEDYYSYEKRINSVTLEDVKKIALIKKYSTAAIVPK